jgi:hypothetical protein
MKVNYLIKELSMLVDFIENGDFQEERKMILIEQIIRLYEPEVVMQLE